MLFGSFTMATVGWVLWQQQALIRRLEHDSFFTGYLLLGSVVLLSSLHLRKRLNFLPLGSASMWLQVHLYLGLAACCVFFAHTRFRWPQGTLEILLYVSFLGTAISGIGGLYWTRSIPRRLSKLRTQVIYEQIPRLRRNLQELVHNLVLKLARQPQTHVIVDWYVQRLLQFLVRPRSFAYFLIPNGRQRNLLQRELTALERFLAASEQPHLASLRQWIDQRDDLDYHEALQFWLKAWLVVHLLFTGFLFVLMMVHTIMAHAFSGMLR